MADQKVTALTEDTSPSAADVTNSVKDPAGTPLDRKVSWLNAVKAGLLGVLTTNGDLVTRTAGAIARITRADLAADAAFSGTYGTPAWVRHLAADAAATSLDEFDDSSFTGWTTVTSGGGQTITEGRGVLSIAPTSQITIALQNCILKANALSVGQAVEVHIRGFMFDDADQLIAGPIITDGTTAGSDAAAFMAQRNTTGPLVFGYPDTGTIGAMTLGTGLGLNLNSGEWYMRLEYDAANTFIPSISIDGVTWHALPSMSVTMTPTHVGFAWCTHLADGTYTSVAIDYIRIVTV